MVQAGINQELYDAQAVSMYIKKKRLYSLKTWYFIALFLILGSILLIPQQKSLSKLPENKLSSVLASLPTPLPTAIPTPTKIMEAPPSKLVISKLSINADVESVTVDDQNRMGVPVGVYNVGWYAYGVKPGEEGTALLDGHYDLTTGAPGIFYNLKSLALGDTIEIYTITGKKLNFLIQEVSSFPSENFPYDLVFSQGTEKRIALITCSGIWSYQKHDYSQRTVVFASLIDSSL